MSSTFLALPVLRLAGILAVYQERRQPRSRAGPRQKGEHACIRDAQLVLLSLGSFQRHEGRQGGSGACSRKDSQLHGCTCVAGSLVSCKGQPASWLRFSFYSFLLTNGNALGWQLMTPRECSARLQKWTAASVGHYTKRMLHERSWLLPHRLVWHFQTALQAQCVHSFCLNSGRELQSGSAPQSKSVARTHTKRGSQTTCIYKGKSNYYPKVKHV